MPNLVQTTAQDLRYALRQLRRATGFSLGVIVVLALGIGANAAIVTVLEATLFRPLPYDRSGDLVLLKTTTRKDQPTSSRLPDIVTLRDRSHTVAELAYCEENGGSLSAPGSSEIPGQPFFSSLSAPSPRACPRAEPPLSNRCKRSGRSSS